MLNLILGRAASGKTTSVLRRIENDKNEKIILLVPDQFSFETEKALIKNNLHRVKVFGFTRLYDTVLNQYGGEAGDKLSDGDKLILLLRVLKEIKGSLSVYKNYSNSLEFCKKVLSFFDEIKLADISFNDLTNANLSSESTKGKIDDLIKIYLHYSALVDKNFIDPADNMQRLYEAVNNHRFFSDYSVYIDGFKDFTGIQLKIIECIIRDSKSTTITFNCDPDDYITKNKIIFHDSYESIGKILSFANKYSVKISDALLLKDNYFLSEDLAFLEKNLFDNNGKQFELFAENINIIENDTADNMINSVMLNIRKLVRTKNYRFRDFVIIARDISKYEDKILAYSAMYKLPVFLDRRRSLKYSPISKFILSALNAAISFKTSEILSYLKSGFSIVSSDELCDLEDYCYIWGIDKGDWFNDWTYSPSGFEENCDKQKDINLLNNLNDTRKKIITPLIELNKKIKLPNADFCKIVYDFIIKNNISEKLQTYLDETENECDFDEKDYIVQSYDAFIDVLSGLSRITYESDTDIKAFIDYLRSSIENTTIGNIPQNLDEISCGSADRIRPARPKIAFIIGLNENEFPMTYSDNSILQAYDRENLNKAGLEIPQRELQFYYKENFILYSNICCSGEKVFLCYYKNDGSTPAYPSDIIRTAKRLFPNCNQGISDNFYDQIETPENAFFVLALNFLNKSDKEPIKTALKNIPEYSSKIENLGKSISIHSASLSNNLINSVYNKNYIDLSPSKIERFFNCKFSYFCNYILKLKKLKKAEINQLKRGTIVHFCLENLIKKYGSNFKNISDETINREIDVLIQEYIKILCGENYKLPEPLKYTLELISASTKIIAKHIAADFAQSDFEPKFFEFSVGEDIEPLKISDIKNIIINGKIDRVDILNESEKYVRIIDYKTGTKEIRLDDELYGINLQMLIYLYALVKGNKELNPAGVFYLHATAKKSDYKDEQDKLCMPGVFLDDDAVLSKMTHEGGGKYIPLNAHGKRMSNPSIKKEDFNTIFSFIEKKIISMQRDILNGDFTVNPKLFNSGTASCKYCDFKDICKIEDKAKYEKLSRKKSNSEVLDLMENYINE